MLYQFVLFHICKTKGAEVIMRNNSIPPKQKLLKLN